MCDNQNVKADRIRCEACRTINLAKHAQHPKVDMQIAEKCVPGKVCLPVTELPLNPTCIKVCDREEYLLRHSGKPLTVPKPPIPYAHGKLMYGVKAGILVGAVYFTYTQGIWGDQQDVTECLRRWSEYVRSINTRRPPSFDLCGNVIKKENPESIFAPIYMMYKEVITTCFEGVVKVPLLVKCAYVDYLEAMKKKYEQEVLERKIRKRG
ncbi:uncharacterized protein LOC128677230 [Plodia interpunctella]|uniref:uncharacterized protein LOC128677230 n=1 Tax=Plodia interpunctella TaxID=58824 RepID=UPI002367E20B|nr:uncharacterized protein LOC128677230 [Plodia interpunctella]